MYDISPEELKETFKRSNKFENDMLINIIDEFPKVFIFGNENSYLTVESRIKNNPNKLILFLDAETCNFTDKGNRKVVEFLLVSKDGRRLWIDVKKADTATNVRDIHGEIYRANNNHGKTIFATKGKAYSSKFLEELNEDFIPLIKVDDTVRVISLDDINSIVNSFTFN